MVNNRFEVSIWKSIMEVHRTVQRDMIKRHFDQSTKGATYPNTVQVRPILITNAIVIGLAIITGVKLNVLKKFEM